MFLRLANEVLDNQQDRLVSGTIEDVSEYKLVAGRVQALREMLRIPLVARERFDRALEAEGERYQEEWAEGPLDDPRGRADYADNGQAPTTEE